MRAVGPARAPHNELPRPEVARILMDYYPILDAQALLSLK
jgi:hypothetical protein